jgi:hypothetical protein
MKKPRAGCCCRAAGRIGGCRNSTLIAPTSSSAWRTAGERLERAIVDTAGAIGQPWQSRTLLAGMTPPQRITSNMQAAGERYVPFAGPVSMVYARDPGRGRVQIAGARLWNSGGGSEAARRRVLAALDALGGMQSPGGSCAWYVLGCEMSLRSWASHANWAAGRIDHKIAAGILVADLGILQAHWGL